ncbi:hypothetical protein L798_08868 [Zootermopsis nevadensis]|uniref:Uncharacterized protein n=1 Tax=Zootermopsis nevadensis TaxID=136037 RepID=A0A067R2H9_ZOONE|nr:hypothetical protein L798_08868 [Zootermopsis nevadensis]
MSAQIICTNSILLPASVQYLPFICHRSSTLKPINKPIEESFLFILNLFPLFLVASLIKAKCWITKENGQGLGEDAFITNPKTSQSWYNDQGSVPDRTGSSLSRNFETGSVALPSVLSDRH